MPRLTLFLHLSERAFDESPTYFDYIGNAKAFDVTRIYHYCAVPNGFKRIESYLASCSFAVSEDVQPPPGDLICAERIPQSSEPNSSLSSRGYPRDSNNLENDDMPQEGGGEESDGSWSYNDVDATDYKNMPDNDPNQEGSVYDSTPNPEAESVALPVKKHSFENRTHIQRYIKLHSEETSSVAGIPANYLLLLFIPGPLNPLASPPPSSLEHSISSKHGNFLAHLSRYPYPTSHENYIRHTGYVLESEDCKAPAQYLVIQEISELKRERSGGISLNWELKRKEAKHWWRKEERGAVGVKVGFFKLVCETDSSGNKLM